MFTDHTTTSFRAVVDRLGREFVGRDGVHSISCDPRRRTIQLHVDADAEARAGFDDRVREEAELIARPYSLAVVFDPPAHALSR